MSVLTKNIITTIIPGNTGIPAYPGTPYIPGHWITTTKEVVTRTLTTYITFIDTNASSQTYEQRVYIPFYTYYTTTVEDTIWVPPVLASPGFAGLPPIPTQILSSLNEGWNSHSRSINYLSPDNYIVYNVSMGNKGAFIGVGPKGMDGMPPSSFIHGIMVDASGIKVRESNIEKNILSSILTNISNIRISRQIDGSIVYVVSAGTNTKVYVSEVTGINKLIPLYAYSHIYRGRESVINASIETGEVQFGEA